jgi:hypothetical protein
MEMELLTDELLVLMKSLATAMSTKATQTDPQAFRQRPRSILSWLLSKL